MQKKNFENVLNVNKNRNIGLYLTNSQFVEGILLDVKNNHIVLEVNGNIVYFAIQQIQALSKNAKDLSIAKESRAHLVRNDLTDVLIALRYHWVTLNKYSNPTLFGILSSIFEDHIILINNKDLLYIPISNITDISSDISKSDQYFLNKKEQIAIQKLYRLGISKASFEVKDEYLVVEQERTILAGIGIIADVTDPLNKEKVSHHAVSSQLEEKLESISGDLAAAEVNILVSEQEASTIDDSVHTEVTETINTNILEENTLSPQLTETQEIFADELEEQIKGEQNNVFSDEQLDLPMKGKDVLLTAWSTMNSDQSTVVLPKKTNSKRELTSPIENTMLTSGNTELNKQISFSNQINENSDREGEPKVLEVWEKSEKKKPLTTANVLSPKEVNEMLEQQYFALMNYAAVQISNAINFKQTGNKLYFHPRIEGSEYGPDKNRGSEMVRGYAFYNSNHDTATLEKQYISLMRHATTMYRKLRQ